MVDLNAVDATVPIRSSTASYDAVLFDLDGTLIDPRTAITRSVQFALTQFGIDVADPDLLLPFIGPPLIESFQRYYRLNLEQAKEAVGAYRDYFRAKGPGENKLYPGIPHLLQNLREAGTEIAIATSKSTVFAEEIVAHFGLDQWIEVIVGSNLDHTRVAKSEVIAFVLSEHQQFRDRSIVMVGDREHDILGARAHGIETIAVSYGYGSREELIAAGAVAIADSVEQLRELLGIR